VVRGLVEVAYHCPPLAVVPLLDKPLADALPAISVFAPNGLPKSDTGERVTQTAGHNMLRDLLVLWSGWGDLNSRPLRPERSALPSCATPRPARNLFGAARDFDSLAEARPCSRTASQHDRAQHDAAKHDWAKHDRASAASG
jgi:hypothetical protein